MLITRRGVALLGSNYMMPRCLLSEVTRDRSARERTSFNTYVGGHMFYLRNNSRAALHRNVEALYAGL